MGRVDLEVHEHDDDFRRDGDGLAHSGFHQPPEAEVIPRRMKAVIVFLACGAGLMSVLAVQRAWKARHNQNEQSRLVCTLLTLVVGMTVGGAVAFVGVFACHAAGLL